MADQNLSLPIEPTFPGARHGRALREAAAPYLLIAPSLVFLIVFFGWPMVEALRIAFVDSTGEPSLANFQRMVSDINFGRAVRNTLLLVVVVVPIQIVLALAMSLMLGRIGKGRDLFLYVWTIPLGIADLAAGIVWLAIFQERGYLNALLEAVGVIDGPQSWLSYETPVTLFVAIVIAEVWRATAIVLVILVAGVQLIPKEYGEAAEVFGATPMRRLFRVTLPLLKPSLQVALILRTIMAFEVVALVFALGGRNLPVLAGEALAWQAAYQNSGVASAYAVLILVVSVAATLLYLRLLRVRGEGAA